MLQNQQIAIQGLLIGLVIASFVITGIFSGKQKLWNYNFQNLQNS